jgi:hypothetical protein
VAREWVEVNLGLPSGEPPHPQLLLTEVVDPLVHGALAERIALWFYFWESQPEPQLRLRLRWRNPEAAEANGLDLAAHLDNACGEGKIPGWYEGSHGQRNQHYGGEAANYGGEMWELIARDWHTGSELALAMTKHQLAGDLTKSIDWLWARRVHLFSNQLLRDEVLLCLRQARGYLSLREATEPDRRMMEAIDSYLADPAGGG